MRQNTVWNQKQRYLSWGQLPFSKLETSSISEYPKSPTHLIYFLCWIWCTVLSLHFHRRFSFISIIYTLYCELIAQNAALNERESETLHGYLRYRVSVVINYCRSLFFLIRLHYGTVWTQSNEWYIVLQYMYTSLYCTKKMYMPSNTFSSSAIP